MDRSLFGGGEGVYNKGSAVVSRMVSQNIEAAFSCHGHLIVTVLLRINYSLKRYLVHQADLLRLNHN